MRIPHTIPKNVCEAYRCSGQTILHPREQSRSIRAEDATWDDSVIPELRILALRVLVERWKDSPILAELPSCVDRDALLEILPIDLPFDLIIKRIPHDYYWSRAARQRWEFNNPEDHGNSWRRLYCERHLAEYLENLEPSYYQSQSDECENLLELVEPHVRILKIRSLMPSKFPLEWSTEAEGLKDEGLKEETNSEEVDDDCDDTENSDVRHIPFAAILPRLSEIRELWLNFGMISVNDGFEWRDFRFAVDDCLGLGRALENSPKIAKFSLTRSDLDQPRVAAVLQGVVRNNNIQEIDFSHCTLGDSGAHAIGEFLRIHKGLRVLGLVNNGIGAEGLAGIVHGLLQDAATPLRRLDLRLNPLRDEGGVHICALLLRNSSLEKLNVSGCGFGPETAVSIAEVISSGYTKFSSLDVDLSNNDLGPIAGEALDAAMKTCSTIVGLDVRMCNVSKESECSISESVMRNMEDKRRERQAMYESQRRSAVSGKNQSLRRPSNVPMEASSRTVQIQQDPSGTTSEFRPFAMRIRSARIHSLSQFATLFTAGGVGATKSILKIGSRQIGLDVSESTFQSSATELSTASSR